VRKTKKNEHFPFFQNLSLHSYEAKSAATLKRDFSETARPKISQKAKIQSSDYVLKSHIGGSLGTFLMR